MARQVKERIDLGDRHPFRPVGDLHNFVPRANPARFDYPEIKSRPVMGNKQSRHLRIVQTNADPVAGHPRLRHFEERFTDDPTALLHALTAEALARGETLEELSVTRPSLEDVYLELTEAVA